MGGFDKADIYCLTWILILSSIEQSVSRLLSCVCARVRVRMRVCMCVQINTSIIMNYTTFIYFIPHPSSVVQ